MWPACSDGDGSSTVNHLPGHEGRADRYHASMTRSDVLDRTHLRWLVNTHWYVQTPDLPALRYDPDSRQLDWLVDQAVWHIQGYGNGYFWGVSATLLYEAGSEVPKQGPRARRHTSTMLGTVTPEGRVHITFIQGSSAENAVLGIGSLIEHEGVPSFEMQMSTGSRSRVLHWAYMLPVKEGDAAWDCLPGVNMSVPKFLEDAPPPIPPH